MIYKYFHNLDFQKIFLERGEVYFNSLSYFLSCEDKNRRDAVEDSSLYRPAEGLEITKAFSQTFLDPRTLISKVKRPERVFVFCTSTELNDNLYKKFHANACIEISNLEEFNRRLIVALHKKMKLGTVKNGTLLSGAVDYYHHEDEPGIRHACPDQIIMSKIADPFFTIEKEYRFAFAKDKNSFDVNNVDYFLTSQIPPFTGQHTHQIFTLGNLSDICRIVS